MAMARTTNQAVERKGRSRLLSWYAGYSMLRGSLATILFGAIAGLGSSFIGAAFGLLIVAWLMSRRHEFQT